MPWFSILFPLGFFSRQRRLKEVFMGFSVQLLRPAYKDQKAGHSIPVAFMHCAVGRGGAGRGCDTCLRGCFAMGALVVTVVVAGVGVLSAELLSWMQRASSC